MFKIHSNIQAKAEKIIYNNTEFLRIPTIILKQGIMHDIYYNSEIVNNNVHLWNGVPVRVGHPEENNAPGSANTFEQDINNIGKLFNSKIVNNKLYTDIYINVDKAKKQGYADLINSFLQNIPTDVSTGLYCEYDEINGLYDNRKYEKVATKIYPDHLAILPYEQGACSQADGCGTLKINKICNCNEVKIMTNKTDIITNLITNKFTQLNSSDTAELEKLDSNLLVKLVPIVQNSISDEQIKEYDKLKANQLANEELEEFKEFQANRATKLEELRNKVKSQYSKVPEIAINQMNLATLEGFLNIEHKIAPELPTDKKVGAFEFPKTFKNARSL